jgi:hypothetical protein
MYDQFEAEKWKFFGIYDERGEVVYKQMANLEPEKAYNKLREWFRQNFGTFTVKVFMKVNSMPSAMEQNTLARFTVEVTGQNQPVGMGTIYGQPQQQYAPVYAAQPSNNVFEGAPNQWSLVDQNHGFRTELQLMKKDHDHQREMDQMRRELDTLKAEQGKSRGMGALVDRFSTNLGTLATNPAFLIGIGTAVDRIINKLSAPQGSYQPAQHITPMNGIPGGIAPTTTGRVDFEVARNADKRRDKLVGAVNQLMESDPDFPENMAKLAALSRSNPAVYKMAISYLNTL